MAGLIFNDRPTSLPCTLALGRPILSQFSYGWDSPIKASQRECSELKSLLLREAESFLWWYDKKTGFVSFIKGKVTVVRVLRWRCQWRDCITMNWLVSIFTALNQKSYLLSQTLAWKLLSLVWSSNKNKSKCLGGNVEDKFSMLMLGLDIHQVIFDLGAI